MSKIFRATLLLFAMTFGIGLYALIGAPVQRIDYTNYLSSAKGALASIGESIVSVLPLVHTLQKNGPINLALTEPANDLPNLKSIIAEDNFGASTTREIIFTKNERAVSGAELIKHFSDRGISDDLTQLLGRSRYFIRHDEDYKGVIFIDTKGNDLTFAAMLPFENHLAFATLGLVHPQMSMSEIRMLVQLGFASRSIAGVDTRALTSSADEPILIWGLKNNVLIIAGDKQSFASAVEKMTSL